MAARLQVMHAGRRSTPDEQIVEGMDIAGHGPAAGCTSAVGMVENDIDGSVLAWACKSLLPDSRSYFVVWRLPWTAVSRRRPWFLFHTIIRSTSLSSSSNCVSGVRRKYEVAWWLRPPGGLGVLQIASGPTVMIVMFFLPDRRPYPQP